jgi:hypothetical protein
MGRRQVFPTGWEVFLRAVSGINALRAKISGSGRSTNFSEVVARDATEKSSQYR